MCLLFFFKHVLCKNVVSIIMEIMQRKSFSVTTIVGLKQSAQLKNRFLWVSVTI